MVMFILSQARIREEILTKECYKSLQYILFRLYKVHGMSDHKKNPSKRYVNDLNRFSAMSGTSLGIQGKLVPFTLAIVFLILAGFFGNINLHVTPEHIFMIVAASVIGGYMALNIGANDVANNMGPAVGGKVLTVTAAVLIAAVFESAGALLAGGDCGQNRGQGHYFGR
jgi:PiT family inorganic phosphate transporter